ncbi:MAG: LysR family transcriptional regulator [Proteobacteria bacterium]|nr:LysR family transcriptional regulator [Pseudomonadota bacterium]
MNRVVKPSSLDLNLLVVFDAIVKDRNVTQAARRVGLSQPAMSSALNRLRRIFNDPLFVRTAEGMMPTPYAQQLAPPIQRACELVENLGDIDTAFDPLSATNTFRFYMTDIGETIFLPKLLTALMERAPLVKIQVLPIPEYGEQAAMAAGSVDLAVGFFPDLKSGFFQQRLYVDEFVCLIRADHPLAKGSMSVKQFAALRHAVVATAGTGHEAAISRAVAKHRLEVALNIPHFMAVPSIIASTDYVVTVPSRLARALVSYPGVRAIEPPVKIPSFEIKQHWHERFHRDPANRWMRALVAELFLE